MTDQQRYDTLRCYGSTVGVTPNLDGLAANGVVFDHCYAASPLCTPSRASLMTGQPVAKHGVDRLDGQLASHHVLLPERLRRLGYQTALFGKHSVSCNSWEAEHRHPHDGFDIYQWCSEPSAYMDSPYQAYAQWLKQYHPEFYDRMAQQGRAVGRIPYSCHMTRWAADSALAFMRQADRQRPFFCMVSLFDPHNPYDNTPIEYERRINTCRLPYPVCLDEDTTQWPQALQLDHDRDCRLTSLSCTFAETASHQTDGDYLYGDERAIVDPFDLHYLMQLRCGYFSSIALIDDEIGRVLNSLQRMDLENQTLVVFCSDHGDMLGDHRLMTKGASLYDPATRVPFVMRWPEKISPGQRVKSVIQLHDLASTLLLAAGADPHDVQHVMPDSFDLMPQACGQSQARRSSAVATCRGLQGTRGIMLRDGYFKLNIYYQLTTCGNPDLDRLKGQLFNMQDDHFEAHNLWNDTKHKDVQNQLLLKISETLFVQ